MTDFSSKMEEYFRDLDEGLNHAYKIAQKARSNGLDPETEPEIPQAQDLASRVEKLVGPAGVAEAIRELEGELSREELAFKIAEMIVDGRFGRLPDVKAAEQAIRTSLAVITEGIAAAAPIEGIVKVDIRKNFDGTSYLALYFAGPIRAAGGTAAALAVLVGDFIRSEFDLSSYEPSDLEVERFEEEVDVYSDVANLQYTPTKESVRKAVRNIPVEITGEPTEQETVTVHRDLDRVETNRIRGGAVLALTQGIIMKAPKLMRRVEELGLDGWEWLSDLSESYLGEREEGPRSYPKKDKYLDDIIAGRPVLGHPQREGGFRLRYGRARNTGLAASGVNPATMRILDDHISVGTQLVTECPGKATVVAPVDSLDGPAVKLEDGTVVQISSAEEAEEVRDEVSEILYLGDLLFGFGEFLENNHPLMPAGYCPEWWSQEVKEASSSVKMRIDLSPYLNPPYPRPSPELAVEISEELHVPLHPDYTYPFHDLELKEIEKLGKWLALGEPEFDNGILKKVQVKVDPDPKRLLERLAVPHKVEGENVIIGEEALPLCRSLGLMDGVELNSEGLVSIVEENSDEDPLEVLKMLAGFPLRAKAPTRIGCRVGRPEKAKPRKMKPAPHVLFPVGRKGGRTRSVPKAAEEKTVEVEAANCRCPKCGRTTIRRKCPECGEKTEFIYFCPKCQDSREGETCMKCGASTVLYREKEIELQSILNDAIGRLEEPVPDEVKGVLGMTSAYKVPEPLEKGILRAKHGVFVFKDGTVRFDATDVPLTHFRPREIKVPPEKLHELGYEEDFKGEPLESDDQLLELKPQDVLLSEPCADYLLRSANFVDDLLEKFYGLSSFYNASSKEDLIGHLVIGLAPHTSAGITGRIIGFSEARVGYAHPYFHAAKRRNCLPGDSNVYLTNPGGLEISNLNELFEEGGDSKIVDDFGTEARTINGKRAISFDPKTGDQRNVEITRVYRAPAPDHKLKITTRSGRRIEVFPNHKIPTSNGVKKALELTKEDELLTPEKIDIPEEDVQRIDLLKIFKENCTSDVVVRGIREFLDEIVRELSGLKETARLLEMNKKTFSNYLYRDSIPMSTLTKLLKLTEKNLGDVPSCRLAAKRDTVELDRWLEINEDFMKTMGYYLAEGYSRESRAKGKECYQTCFAFGDEEIKNDMISSINKSLNVDPAQDGHELAICSRLVRELFTQILNLGHDAYSKSIPPSIKRLPKKKIAHLLAAYFSGDGSIEKGRLHICVHSVNRGLLEDVSFLLTRFGIFSRFRTENREASGALLEKYSQERYEGKKFITHSLSIRSTYAVRFGEEIGFTIPSKQIPLENDYSKERKPRIRKRGSLIKDPIKSLKFEKNEEPYMHDIEVEGTHKFLTDECLLTNNCDGDEDALMLLLDALLNFSQYYLPEKRGGRMDAPLVLTTRLDPSEIDEEAHNMDLMGIYPTEFYEATLGFDDPRELASKIETVKERLDGPSQYEDLQFSHDLSSISKGPRACKYKSLGSMVEKTDSQLTLAEKIMAVDERDVAERVIENHFIPDLKGNLRAFATQDFRCTSCNRKYRRVPLSGECPRCGGNLMLNVHQGGVEKYLPVAIRLAENYKVSNYLRQRLDLVHEEIRSLFESDDQEQLSLADFA